MLQKLNQKANMVAIKLHLKKEEVKNQLLHGNKDELHEMMGIGTTIAVAAMVFGILYGALKLFAPTFMTTVEEYFMNVIKDAFTPNVKP